MTVPVHNLYDFVHQVTKRKYLLLYFYPWGQKDITDIHRYLNDRNFLDGPNGIPNEHRICPKQIEKINWQHDLKLFQPIILCHDQEPLNFDLYVTHGSNIQDTDWVKENQIVNISCPDLLLCNLRLALPASIQKTWILLHSELNSHELKKYTETGRFSGAYWWSHAVIARDWYRFAQYDQSLKPSEIRRLFLTYCRDSSGTRTYRKDFLGLIQSNNLQSDCQFRSFDNTEASADSSAVYNAEDFNHTGISVVLETVFDQRIHLTEKILRAIACGHPFILAAGPASLELLRSYGFHTFHGFINEEYDTIPDNDARLGAIVAEMHRIASLSDKEQKTLIESIRGIAALNKKRFFSEDFFQQVVSELQKNVADAFEEHQGKLDFELWWQRRCLKKQHYGPGWKQIPNVNRMAKVLVPLVRQQRLAKRINLEQ